MITLIIAKEAWKGDKNKQRSRVEHKKEKIELHQYLHLKKSSVYLKNEDCVTRLKKTVKCSQESHLKQIQKE